MKKFEKIATPDLLSYMTICDNLYQSTGQLGNEIAKISALNKLSEKEHEQLLAPIREARKDIESVYFDIQKEADERLRNATGLKFGIRRMQSIFQSVEDELAKFERREIENLEQEKSKVVDLNPDNNADTTQS